MTHNELINSIDSDTAETGNEYLGVEPEIEHEDLQPFDPEKISIDKKPITMDACLRRLDQGTIILAPDFQRNEVWTQEKKCRLIESLMLKIPIPMFYVSADEKGNFAVVDGLQRLSTIRSFILGDKYIETKEERYKGEGFKLSCLEFWGERFNEFRFNDLPINIQNRLLETEFTFTIINPGTPEEVKRNVFKRINTGGEPLTPQEIRHALYIGKSSKLLLDLSKKQEFLEATSYSVKANRMMDRELILRFLSFSIRDFSSYSRNNDMDSFLSDTMRLINSFPDLNTKDVFKILKNDQGRKQILINNIDNLDFLFVTAMKRAKKLFADQAFRKSYGTKRKTQINKALFEVWSVLLSKLTNDEFDNLLFNKQPFLEHYHTLIEDSSFQNAISRDSWKFSGVKHRFESLTFLLNQYTNA